MTKNNKTKRSTRSVPAGQTARKLRQKPQEVTRLGYALRALGGLGGTALGGLVGQPGIGGGYGTGLGAMLSKWLGSGDYKISQNSIVKGALNGSASIPAMHNTGQSITIRHKEFLTEVKGSTTFQLQRFFMLQPGDSNTFPWLNGIAAKFQQYRIKGMVFHYVPTSGYAVSGTNPAIGSVMMQTTYRANDNAPVSKVEMLNEYWASEAAPTESFCHPIECSPNENPFSVHYVRTLPVPTADSPLMYDLGKTFIATSGMPATGNVVGDLWVTYEIELSKPVVTSSVSVDSVYSYITSTSPTTGSWFAATVYSGIMDMFAGANTITFPDGIVGSFLIMIRIVPSTVFTAIDLSGAPTLTNCIAGPVDSTGTTYNRSVIVAATSANSGYYVTSVVIKSPADRASVVFPNGTWSGTAAYTYATITQFA